MSKLAISRIAPILEVNEDEIKSWILADKYPLQTFQIAIDAKQD